jgi:hypothetical protein
LEKCIALHTRKEGEPVGKEFECDLKRSSTSEWTIVIELLSGPATNQKQES